MQCRSHASYIFYQHGGVEVQGEGRKAFTQRQLGFFILPLINRAAIEVRCFSTPDDLI